MKNRKILGTTLIIIMLILMGLSIAMIASVSFPRGLKEYNNHYYFLIRQIIWLVAGSILFIFTANFEYTKYKRIRKLLYLIGFLMLLAVLGIGKNVNGATRWIAIGQFSIQPSEFAKLILILHLAGLIDLKKRKRENKLKMLFSILAATMTYSVLIIMEKAFSSTAQITLIGLTMMFISGVKMSEFLVTLLGLGVLGFGAITAMPYRRNGVCRFDNTDIALYGSAGSDTYNNSKNKGYVCKIYPYRYSFNVFAPNNRKSGSRNGTGTVYGYSVTYIKLWRKYNDSNNGGFRDSI